jgi:hypothetical protein
MTKASDEFEIMISRIHELLEGEGASVEWNERIPDPDNPKQMRQVDVLIRKNGLVNLVECRLHKEPQDVKWIEELIGRRISLEASAIAAVSTSGFTSGAVKKAEKYGIILRDLNDLSDAEIKSWARSVEVAVYFYRYEGFKLTFFFDVKDATSINIDQLQKDLRNYFGLRSLFTAQLKQIDDEKLIIEENRGKRFKFRANFFIEGFELCGYKVQEIQSEGFAYLEEIKLHVPEVLAYGEVEMESKERNVYIQKFNLGDTKVIHHDGHIAMSLDLSKLDIPPYWQFRFVEVLSNHENYFDSLDIVHPEKIIMPVDEINVSITGKAG